MSGQIRCSAAFNRKNGIVSLIIVFLYFLLWSMRKLEKPDCSIVENMHMYELPDTVHCKSFAYIA